MDGPKVKLTLNKNLKDHNNKESITKMTIEEEAVIENKKMENSNQLLLQEVNTLKLLKFLNYKRKILASKLSLVKTKLFNLKRSNKKLNKKQAKILPL